MRDVIQVCALGNSGSTSSSAGSAATNPTVSDPMTDEECVNVKQLDALVPCFRVWVWALAQAAEHLVGAIRWCGTYSTAGELSPSAARFVSSSVLSHSYWGDCSSPLESRPPQLTRDLSLVMGVNTYSGYFPEIEI